MAVTKTHPIKSTLKAAIDYIVFYGNPTNYSPLAHFLRTFSITLPPTP